MIKNSSALPITVKENMRDGNGSTIITHISDSTEMHDKSRLFARVTLKPGCSIGFHVHENETEIFYILSGTALYDDNGVSQTISAGDTTVTAPGQGHSIANEGSENVEMIALIILK